MTSTTMDKADSNGTFTHMGEEVKEELLEEPSPMNTTDEKTFCNLCDTFFANNEALVLHDCSAYREQTSFTLSNAKNRTWTQSYRSYNGTMSSYKRMKQRVTRYGKRKPANTARVYQCEICAEQFLMQLLLHRHMQTHVGNPLMCNACHQVFLVEDSLLTHKCRLQDQKHMQSVNTNGSSGAGTSKPNNHAPIASPLVVNLPTKQHRKGVADTNNKKHSTSTAFLKKNIDHDCDSSVSNKRELVELTRRSKRKGNLASRMAQRSTSISSRNCKTKRLHKTVKKNQKAGTKKCMTKLNEHKDRAAKAFAKIKCEKTNTLCCSDCGTCFDSPKHLAAHKMSKVPCKVRKKFECEVCDAKFFFKKHLGDHYAEMHSSYQASNKWETVCPDCGADFGTPKKLSTHKASKVSCKVRKKFQCNICSSRFLNAVLLHEHCENVHGGNVSASGIAKSVECLSCSLKFTSTANLIKHYQHSLPCRPYSCTQCDVTCSTRKELLDHKATHYGHKVPCDVCKNMFANKSALKKHMRLHTGVKPHKCLVCGESFVQSAPLKSHCNRHHKEKDWSNTIFTIPISCKICKTKLETLDQFDSHDAQNCEAANKFPCSVCGKLFKSNGLRNYHFSVFHESKR